MSQQVRTSGRDAGATSLEKYCRQQPDTVREYADHLENDGREELAGYLRYRLALANDQLPDSDDAEAAGLPMPEELTPLTEVGQP